MKAISELGDLLLLFLLELEIKYPFEKDNAKWKFKKTDEGFVFGQFAQGQTPKYHFPGKLHLVFLATSHVIYELKMKNQHFTDFFVTKHRYDDPFKAHDDFILFLTNLYNSGQLSGDAKKLYQSLRLRMVLKK